MVDESGLVTEIKKEVLIPGEFYAVSGMERTWNSGGKMMRFYPAMYVRDEKFTRDWGTWHVFAVLDNQNCLTRVRVLVDNISIERGFEVKSKGDLVTRSIMYSKFQRESLGEHLVNQFIHDAYELIRVRGPHVTTLEKDARDLASCDDEKARLRIIIDRHYESDINYDY